MHELYHKSIAYFHLFMHLRSESHLYTKITNGPFHYRTCDQVIQINQSVCLCFVSSVSTKNLNFCRKVVSCQHFFLILCQYFSVYLYYFVFSILIGGGCTAIVYLVLYANFSDILPTKGSGDSTDFISTYATTIIFSLINLTVPSCIKLVSAYM